MEEKNLPTNGNGFSCTTPVNQSPNKHCESKLVSTKIQIPVSNSELKQTDIYQKESSADIMCGTGSSASSLLLEDFAALADQVEQSSSENVAENISMLSSSKDFDLESGRSSKAATFDFNVPNLSSKEFFPNIERLHSAKSGSFLKDSDTFDFPHSAFLRAQGTENEHPLTKYHEDTITNDAAAFLSNYASNNNRAEKSYDFGTSWRNKVESSPNPFQKERSISDNSTDGSNSDNIIEYDDFFDGESLHDAEMMDNTEEYSTSQECALLDLLKAALEQFFSEIDSIEPSEDVEDTKMLFQGDNLDSKNNAVNFSTDIKPFSESPGISIEESPINVEAVDVAKINSISEQNFYPFKSVDAQINLQENGYLPAAISENLVDSIVMHLPTECCDDKNLKCNKLFNLNVNDPSADIVHTDIVNNDSILEEFNLIDSKINEPENDCSRTNYSGVEQENECLHSKDAVLAKEHEENLFGIGSTQTKHSSYFETTEISEPITHAQNFGDPEIIITGEYESGSSFSNLSESTEISKIEAQDSDFLLEKYLRDATTKVVNDGNTFSPTRPFEVLTKDISSLPSDLDSDVQSPAYAEDFEESKFERTNSTSGAQLSNEPSSFVYKFLLGEIEQPGNGFPANEHHTESTEHIERLDLEAMDVEKENAFQDLTETRGMKRKRFSPHASRKRFKASASSADHQESKGLLKAVPLILNRPRRQH